jgi:putative transcriptional regulator
MTEFNDIEAGLRDALRHAQGAQDGKAHRIEVPVVDVKAVRSQLGMSQAMFADAFGVTVATLRNWEQGRRIPRGPARILLNIIEQEPDAVQRVLHRSVA